jgi:hypothetical protein
MPLRAKLSKESGLMDKNLEAFSLETTGSGSVWGGTSCDRVFIAAIMLQPAKRKIGVELLAEIQGQINENGSKTRDTTECHWFHATRCNC